MIQFSLFRIPVTVLPWFWVTMALIGAGFSGADNATEIFRLALFVIAGFISILVHEMGHALTVKAFGAPTSITLEAFGGYATHPSGFLNRWQSFLVTAAGPAIQLLLGGLAILPVIYLPEAIPDGAHSQYFLGVLFSVSMFWALINLLPILPLDGGQLVNAVLGPSRIRITLWITIAVGAGAAIALFLKTQMILFPLIFGFYAYQAFKALKEIPRR